MKMSSRQRYWIEQDIKRFGFNFFVFLIAAIISFELVRHIVPAFYNFITQPIVVNIKTETVITPCPKDGCIQIPNPTATPTPKPKKPLRVGKASYYSVDGCIGCNPGRIMANGEKLDDTRLTLAYNHLPMNTVVTVRNTKTGVAVKATVTDTGGFEPLGKIADLSVATRDALGCGSLCPIAIEL